MIEWGVGFLFILLILPWLAKLKLKVTIDGIYFLAFASLVPYLVGLGILEILKLVLK